MNNCGNKIKQTCGETTFAACVSYEGDLPEFSELEECSSIEDTTEELYKLVGELKEETDLTTLGETCLEYVLDEGKIVVRNVLLKYEEEICLLKEQVTALQNTEICTTSITGCNLEWGDLVTSCGDTPGTLVEALQVIIDKLNTP